MGLGSESSLGIGLGLGQGLAPPYRCLGYSTFSGPSRSKINLSLNWLLISNYFRISKSKLNWLGVRVRVRLRVRVGLGLRYWLDLPVALRSLPNFFRASRSESSLINLVFFPIFFKSFSI